MASINIPEYPNNNSHETIKGIKYSTADFKAIAAGQPEEKAAPVVKVNGTIPKKRLGDRFAKAFAKDLVVGYAEMVWQDIFLPNLKICINRSLVAIINQLTGFGGPPNSNYYGRVNYTGYPPNVLRGARQNEWDYSNTWPSVSYNGTGASNPYAGGCVVFHSKADAEAVLGGLADRAEAQSFISYGELLDLSGLGAKVDHTMYTRGWRNISQFTIAGHPEGIALNYPPMIPLS